jgi:DUF4097 and DUF4098 domain-containing protein YvlB
MPTFDTPEPISVTVEFGVGDLRIVAGERSDTIVEVRPSDASNKSDVNAAHQTRVEYANGRLLIKAPKGWKQHTSRGGDESIDVQIDLPAGSHVRAEAGAAAFHCSGRLGECHFKTGVGEIRVDEAGASELKAGAGDITVGRASGHAEVTTGTGAVRIDRIDGTAVVKNSNGDTWIGKVGGDLRVNAANGKITVDQAEAGVAAKTANGDVRLGEVVRSAIVAETACGAIDLGVRDGVAAWLDLDTRFGNVHSDLDAAERPHAGEDAVEVRARTSFGDITVRHAPARATDPVGQP